MQEHRKGGEHVRWQGKSVGCSQPFGEKELSQGGVKLVATRG